jgi:hypothetical protein
VIVPVRAAPVLAAAAYVTDPGPVPLDALVMVSHVTLDLAVHAQALSVCTWTTLLPPAAAID